MRKSILKTSVYMACLAWSGLACAAGLGGINVTSSLGQPLRAEIEMVSVEKLDKSTLTAKLASPEAFKNAGVEYPYGLPKISFQIERNADDVPYIKVTSSQPVNEPFVTLLVELNWASGKLLREYTFLLDPPNYKLEQPKPEEVNPIEPVLAAPILAPVPEVITAAPLEETQPVPSADTPAATESAEAAAPEMAAPVEQASAEQTPAEQTPAEQTPVAEQAPTEAPTEQAAVQESAPVETPLDALSKEEAIAETATEAPSAETITVVRGDSLSKIAAQIKPADVSLERMLVALYRENTAVFDAHNMNRIRAGKILVVPSAEAIRMQPQADAEEEIRIQAADWNVYRQKLAAARAATAERADKQEAAGTVVTTVTDQAASKEEPSKEVLKLSKGEAPGDKAVGAGKTTAKEQAVAKEEEAIAKNKALKEAQERTAILEKSNKDLQRLADLKKGKAASAPAEAAAMNAASAPAATDTPKPKPKVIPPTVVEEPSLVDQLLSDPMYMAGGAAVLLLLGGAGFMLARRGKQGGGKTPGNRKEDIGSNTARIAAPVVASPETGDFTQAAFASAPASSGDAEEVDPIGEADLFLTFGRDAQAEEVLKEALNKNPNNLPVKIKLLSIYATRKDTNSFYNTAREIKESGDATGWSQAASMGRELEPSNPYYGGAAATSASASAGKSAAEPAVDFDLGFGNTAVRVASDFSNQSTVVLETPSEETTTIMPSATARAASQATPMDFDITGTNPGVPAVDLSGGNTETTTALNMDDLVFDVTSTHPGTSKLPGMDKAAAPAKADDGMTFTLDFPGEAKKPAAAPAKPDIGLDEISLNLDSLGASSGTGAAGGKDEHWHEVATKLDLAKAYQEMGDVAGAREILDEVVRDGDQQQRETAQNLLQQL